MIKASVIGATGFTGALLTELLARHPQVALAALTSQSYVGRQVADVFPWLRVDGTYAAYDPASAGDADVAFVCYPHAQAHPVVAELLERDVRVVDLSADFRLKDAGLYPEWYGFEHPAAGLLREAVYGLPEVYRADIAGCRLVANPGCFPTGMLLGLLPLARRGLVASPVVVDSASGVSGPAARPPRRRTSPRCTTTSGPTARSGTGTPRRWSRSSPCSREPRRRQLHAPSAARGPRHPLHAVRAPRRGPGRVGRGLALRALPDRLRGRALRGGRRTHAQPARGAGHERLPHRAAPR